MSVDLVQAAVADVRRSEDQALQLAQILAVVQAAQSAAPAPAAHAACSCSHGKAGGSAGRWAAGPRRTSGAGWPGRPGPAAAGPSRRSAAAP